MFKVEGLRVWGFRGLGTGSRLLSLRVYGFKSLGFKVHILF